MLHGLDPCISEAWAVLWRVETPNATKPTEAAILFIKSFGLFANPRVDAHLHVYLNPAIPVKQMLFFFSA